MIKLEILNCFYLNFFFAFVQMKWIHCKENLMQNPTKKGAPRNSKFSFPAIDLAKELPAVQIMTLHVGQFWNYYKHHAFEQATHKIKQTLL